MSSAARNAPSVARNREPILDVLRPRLPRPGTVLEIASGTGEHAVFLAAAMPDITWQPTDRDAEAIASIAAWRDEERVPNLLPPLLLDAAVPDNWPAIRADAVIAINMIHISPWSSTEGLIAGAARLLPQRGMLILYGPFREGGRHTTESNADFDASLRERDPAWGVRDIDAVAALAATRGLAPAERIAMPANNLTLIFRRSQT